MLQAVVDLNGSRRCVLIREASKPLDHNFFEGEDTKIVTAFVRRPIFSHVESVVDAELEFVLQAVKLSNK